MLPTLAELAIRNPALRLSNRRFVRRAVTIARNVWRS